MGYKTIFVCALQNAQLSENSPSECFMWLVEYQQDAAQISQPDGQAQGGLLQVRGVPQKDALQDVVRDPVLAGPVRGHCGDRDVEHQLQQIHCRCGGALHCVPNCK